MAKQTRTRRLSAEEAQDKRMHELLEKPLGEFAESEWDELRALTRGLERFTTAHYDAGLPLIAEALAQAERQAVADFVEKVNAKIDAELASYGPMSLIADPYMRGLAVGQRAVSLLMGQEAEAALSPRQETET